jgi:DNA-binding NarL/FixJ family response regulator
MENENQPRPAQQLRVFVAEDSSHVRDRVKQMLAVAGAADAGHAAEVAAATEAILETRPDVVILDMQLADGTGFEVLRAVRHAAPEIDVYFFSNYAADAYRELAERLGARGFFDKTREFERMREIIAQRCASQH